VPLPHDYDGQNCALARALEIVGERWTLLILRDLFFGVHRFNDLQVHLDIPKAVLSARLSTLAEHGLIERDPYRLTARGRELWPILHGLMEWGDRHFGLEGGAGRVFAHAACGSDLDPTGECPACKTDPHPEDVVMRLGPGKPRVRRTDPVTRALREPHRLLTPLARE
jgi:DNA-binding HxlR family transcriptional regulator